MAIAGKPIATLTMFEIRWISGQKEGCCYIRAVDEEDAINEFHRHPAFYGSPHENPFAWAIPVRVSETRP